MPKITLTEGDFGEGSAAADLSAFHLPDPVRPGAVLLVPFTEIAEMTVVRSDNTNRVKTALRTGLGGLLSMGPAGASAALLAAGKAPQTVFAVRLNDGRGFTAIADAGTVAELHAAEVEARGAAGSHPADAIIAKYLAGASSAKDTPPVPDPSPVPEAQPNADAVQPEPPRPTRPFGRRGL